MARHKCACAIFMLTGGVLALLGCSGSGGNSPTAPASLQPITADALRLTEADLLVGGQSVDGMILTPGHGEGQAAFFRAELMMDGSPASGYQVWVQYDRPMGMMGANRGQFLLYDDGTHGDRTPGDGIYCFRDVEARYGCSGPGMMQGEYHYEFWGEQMGGQETNHLYVRVRLEEG